LEAAVSQSKGGEAQTLLAQLGHKDMKDME